MKKSIAFLFTVLLTMMLSACGSSTQDPASAASEADPYSAKGIVSQDGSSSAETSADPSPASSDAEPVSDAAELQAAEHEPVLISDTEGIDVDLSSLNATMVYSEVYDMMYYPEAYLGKTIRMTGICSVYHSESLNKDYYACVIQDATACCAQGIEFILNEDCTYPEDGDVITVTGVFDTYKEGEYFYTTLLDAVLD